MCDTSPDITWTIQDLDVMYPPQDRPPAYSVKDGDLLAMPDHASSGSQQRLQQLPTVPPIDNVYANQYGGAVEAQGGEWPADLENIHLDCDLPTKADSPLNLENYNMTKVMFVDPGTQSPSIGTPHFGLSHGQSAPLYDQTASLVTMETLQPEVMPMTIPDGARSGRRGRPRAEWRINKRGPGRPRNKPGRKPGQGLIKTEIPDEENVYPDLTEEKRERRREQNRRAARKLREKKKVHVEHMKKNYEHILSENHRLLSEIDNLKRIISELKAAKTNHICVCSYSPQSVTSQTTGAYVSGNDSRGSFNDVIISSTLAAAPSSNLLTDLV